jgi:hypothetical protein
MAPENRRHIDNVRSILRDISSYGSLVGVVALVFYAGKLVERFDNSIAAQNEINITTKAELIAHANDISVLRDWKVATTQQPFTIIADTKEEKKP